MVQVDDTAPPVRRVPRGRLVLLLGALISVLTGLNAALLRLGASAPIRSESLAAGHGVLMVYGFVGTAITLERAVAMQSGRARWAWSAYLSPAASGVGSVLLIAQAPRVLPAAAWMVSMLALLGIYLAVWRRQPAPAVLVQGLGAMAGLVGIALWGRGFEAATIVPWWAALLVLTVVGERLELARIALATGHTEQRVLAESCAVLVALVLTVVAPGAGYPLLGLALGVLMVDLLLHDVARRTIRATGLTRFMAACMLTGYGWALVAAGIWLVGGPALSGYRYDTVIHALTIGFVLSMILAHAPVIVPAIARRPLPYHPVMWAVWGLLHVGLAIRVVAGARSAAEPWRFGGALSVVALLAFLVTTVTLILTGPRR